MVRGGYGIFYDSPNLNGFGDNRPPNSGATGVIYNPAGLESDFLHDAQQLHHRPGTARLREPDASPAAVWRLLGGPELQERVASELQP